MAVYSCANVGVHCARLFLIAKSAVKRVHTCQRCCSWAHGYDVMYFTSSFLFFKLSYRGTLMMNEDAFY